MSGGNASKGKGRPSRRQEGWEEAGGEFYQESYPGGAEQEMLDHLQVADANKLATLLPSKQLRAATAKRARSHNERRQSTFARTNVSRDVKLSMLPDLSENLSNEERTWEEMMQIKAMPVPMAQKLQLKAQLQNATRLRLVGVAALAWRRRVAWQRVRARARELLHVLEPWRAHIHLIEGQFGTGVAAYFLFLRWLLALNLALSLPVALLLMVPASVLERAPRLCADAAWNDTACCSERYAAGADAPLRPLDVLQATGAVEHTILFYGFYGDQVYHYTVRLLEGATVHYNMPLAYISVTLGVFALSLAALVRAAARGARTRLVEREGQLYHYCGLVFAGWDCCVRSERAAAAEHGALYNYMKRHLDEEKRHEEEQQRSGRERACLLLKRVLVNLLVVAILAGSAAAIVVAFHHSERYTRPADRAATGNASLGAHDAWQSAARLETLALEYLPSACIVLLNLFVPELFSWVVRAERYAPSLVVRVTLLRTVLLRLSSLGVLLGQMYVTVVARDPASCAPAARELQCWETYVGQQLYKLALANFAGHSVVTFLVDFPRAWVARHASSRCFRMFGEHEFNLPKHVLDAVYAQTIVWLGVLYCPALPVLGAVLGFLSFYVKRFACVVNSTPSPVAYRAPRSQSAFMFVLLLSYAMTAMPVAYSVAELVPSLGCGPFRGRTTAWSLLADAFLSLPEPLRRSLRLLGTAAAAVPAFAILLLLLYYYWAVAAANRHMVRVLKNQLVLEGHDKQFLLNRLGAFIRQHQRRYERVRTRADTDTHDTH